MFHGLIFPLLLRCIQQGNQSTLIEIIYRHYIRDVIEVYKYLHEQYILDIIFMGGNLIWACFLNFHLNLFIFIKRYSINALSAIQWTHTYQLEYSEHIHIQWNTAHIQAFIHGIHFGADTMFLFQAHTYTLSHSWLLCSPGRNKPRSSVWQASRLTIEPQSPHYRRCESR